ncbi:MAG: hypothetical protein DRN65_02120 [Thaumarchaeota archaeon]|nr:MAG: hypothetical protein DRN65_02120 [Nitrososphaerota archaeon]
MSIYEDLDSLARMVLEVDDKVQDPMEVAAILEAIGVTQEAVRELGYENMFDLAREVLRIADYYRSLGEIWGEEKPTRVQRLLEAIKLFLSGVLFSSPWLFITISYMFFGISLLPVYEDPLRATAIDLAMILSMTITSILPPIFLRRLQFHYYQEDYLNSQRLLIAYYLLGLAVTSVSAISIWLGFSGAPYPSWWTIYLIIYFIPFSFFWLAVSPLYFFRRYAALAISYLVALGFIGVMYRLMGAETYLINIYGLLLGAFFSMIYSITFLYIRFKILGVGSEPTAPPRLPFVAYSGLSYAFVGALYFLLIFSDRFIVWSISHTGYPLLANIEYEKAANLSLLVLVLPFGAMNYYLTRLYECISKEGEKYRMKEIEEYRRAVFKIYLRGLLMTTILGAVSLLSLYHVLSEIGWIASEFQLRIFVLSGISYCMIPLFYLGWLLSCSLYKPEPYSKFLGLAIIISIILCMAFNRILGMEYTPAGFAVSTTIMALLSLRNSLKDVKEIDQVYLSAF